MPFPDSDRVIYGNSPLMQVLCQFRFPTILEISSADPAEYQNRIREQYPLYERRSVLPQETTELLQKVSAPLPPSAVAHAFTMEDGKREIVLANGFLAFSDTAYARWERFLEAVVMARTALEEVYEPAFYSRIGLRYIDMIYWEDLGLRNAHWADLLNPALAGLLADGDVALHVTESNSQAIIRLAKIDETAHVKLRYGFAREAARPDEVGFLVDADFSTTKKRRVLMVQMITELPQSSSTSTEWPGGSSAGPSARNFTRHFAPQLWFPEEDTTGGPLLTIKLTIEDEEEAVMRLRLACCLLIATMPKTGLQEAAETLRNITDFYAEQPAETRFGAPRFVGTSSARIKSVRQRPDLTLSLHWKKPNLS